jgi:hypothetical protein
MQMMSVLNCPRFQHANELPEIFNALNLGQSHHVTVRSRDFSRIPISGSITADLTARDSIARDWSGRSPAIRLVADVVCLLCPC